MAVKKLYSDFEHIITAVIDRTFLKSRRPAFIRPAWNT